MNLTDIFQLFKSRLWENIRIRSVVFSLMIHASFLLVYVILNMKTEVSVYDFGFDSNYNGLPQQSQKKKGKKVKLMERSSEEIIPREKSANGEQAPQKEETSETSGDEGEIADAVDMAFMPGARTPSMLGGLKQYYPAQARELNVEATVYTSVIISKKGKVLKVKVLSVQLSKKLPPDQEASLKAKFAASITRSFSEVVFTRPEIEGKNIPIEMEQVIHYRLSE